MKTILVTGACGLIGEKICSGLLKKGNKVIGADSKSSEYNLCKTNYIFYQASCVDKNSYDTIFENEHIDCVIHAACTVDNDFPHIITENEIQMSERCDKFIYDMSIAAGVTQLIMLSTTQVYEVKKTREPMREDDQIKIVTNYAKMKYESERTLSFCVKKVKNLACAILRFSPVYTFDYVENFLCKVIDPKEKTAFVYRTGDYGFQCCCVHNLVDFIIGYTRAADDPAYTGIYNICDTNLTSASEMIAHLRTHHNLGPVLQRNYQKDLLMSKISGANKDMKTDYRFLDYSNFLNNNMIDNKKAARLGGFRWNITNAKP